MRFYTYLLFCLRTTTLLLLATILSSVGWQAVIAWLINASSHYHPHPLHCYSNTPNVALPSYKRQPMHVNAHGLKPVVSRPGFQVRLVPTKLACFVALSCALLAHLDKRFENPPTGPPCPQALSAWARCLYFDSIIEGLKCHATFLIIFNIVVILPQSVVGA